MLARQGERLNDGHSRRSVSLAKVTSCCTDSAVAAALPPQQAALKAAAAETPVKSSQAPRGGEGEDDDDGAGIVLGSGHSFRRYRCSQNMLEPVVERADLERVSDLPG